ncbi:uncharacterized protein [Triticum aestivum]|nr:uncharacterized protein LOC123056127 [Triticum aestivum]
MAATAVTTAPPARSSASHDLSLPTPPPEPFAAPKLPQPLAAGATLRRGSRSPLEPPRVAAGAGAARPWSRSPLVALCPLTDVRAVLFCFPAAVTLRDARASIDSFLSRLDAPVAVPSDSDQPMADGGEAGEPIIGKVEDGLPECALQGNQRQKRPVPPSWPLGPRSSGAGMAPEATTEPALDVQLRRGTAMDLLLQFHA